MDCMMCYRPIEPDVKQRACEHRFCARCIDSVKCCQGDRFVIHR